MASLSTAQRFQSATFARVGPDMFQDSRKWVLVIASPATVLSIAEDEQAVSSATERNVEPRDRGQEPEIPAWVRSRDRVDRDVPFLTLEGIDGRDVHLEVRPTVGETPRFLLKLAHLGRVS